ncbi:MAG TPA: hypothetical protein HA349_06625 [Methanotrichaceae archaeon]|nr:hypothetical protein [Methanotrichaceae archaeon]
MDYQINKAIVYDGPEDTYGPCGCGMDMAILPVLLPKIWFEDEFPIVANDHEFCRGVDCRRIMGLSCNRVFEHEMEGVTYLSNFSCCRECADRAVDEGYAIRVEKESPMGVEMNHCCTKKDE